MNVCRVTEKPWTAAQPPHEKKEVGEIKDIISIFIKKVSPITLGRLCIINRQYSEMCKKNIRYTLIQEQMNQLKKSFNRLGLFKFYSYLMKTDPESAIFLFRKVLESELISHELWSSIYCVLREDCNRRWIKNLKEPLENLECRLPTINGKRINRLEIAHLRTLEIPRSVELEVQERRKLTEERKNLLLDTLIKFPTKHLEAFENVSEESLNFDESQIERLLVALKVDGVREILKIIQVKVWITPTLIRQCIYSRNLDLALGWIFEDYNLKRLLKRDENILVHFLRACKLQDNQSALNKMKALLDYKKDFSVGVLKFFLEVGLEQGEKYQFNYLLEGQNRIAEECLRICELTNNQDAFRKIKAYLANKKNFSEDVLEFFLETAYIKSRPNKKLGSDIVSIKTLSQAGKHFVLLAEKCEALGNKKKILEYATKIIDLRNPVKNLTTTLISEVIYFFEMTSIILKLIRIYHSLDPEKAKMMLIKESEIFTKMRDDGIYRPKFSNTFQFPLQSDPITGEVLSKSSVFDFEKFTLIDLVIAWLQIDPDNAQQQCPYYSSLSPDEMLLIADGAEDWV